jgi:hypothetical protein
MFSDIIVCAAVTRLLHRERRVLHRDISSVNVLIKSPNRDRLSGENKYGFYSAEYILNPSGGRVPMESDLLLIDFDRSQILNTQDGALYARTVSFRLIAPIIPELKLKINLCYCPYTGNAIIYGPRSGCT